MGWLKQISTIRHCWSSGHAPEFYNWHIPGNLFDVIQKTANLVVAPLFVLFFMAMYVPFATEKGTFIAGIASILFAMAVAFSEFMGIKSLWIMPASLIAGVLSGMAVSGLDHLFVKLRKS